MPYLRDLPTCFYDGCTKAAVVELIGKQNASYGKYCRPHGDVKLKELDREYARQEQEKNRRLGGM